MPRDAYHVSATPHSHTVIGRRIRALREELGWSQERVGVAIGIDESSARARISRYELGVHEPPLPTVRKMAEVLDVPVSYLYCEDDRIALLLLKLHRISDGIRSTKVEQYLSELVQT